MLCRRTAAALQLKDDPQYESTIDMVLKFNNVFDILNISSTHQGVSKRNKFKESITTADDWRFEVTNQLPTVTQINGLVLKQIYDMAQVTLLPNKFAQIPILTSEYPKFI